MQRVFNVLRVFICVAMMSIAVANSATAQCAMCKKSLTESSEGRHIAQGINNGILFLLAVPVATFGTIGILIARGMKRRDSENGVEG